MEEELINEPDQTSEDPFSAFGGKTVKQPKNPFQEFGGTPVQKKPSGRVAKNILPPSNIGGQNDPNFLGLTNSQPQSFAPVVDPATKQQMQQQSAHANAIDRAKQVPKLAAAPKKDSSIFDDISEALYVPAINKGFSDLVIKPAAGATDFIDRTIDKAYQAVTGEQTPEWLRKKGAFHNLSEWVDKGYEERKKPTNIVSETIEGVAGTLPLIASLYTGQGEATLAAKAPQFISKATKMLATTGALNAFKDATDKGEDLPESLASAAKGGAEGGLTGLTIEAQMLVGGALGKGVANKLAEKGLFKGGKAGEAILHALSVGTIFGGTAAGEDLMNGRDIDTHNVAKQFGMGLAFEALPVASALGKEVGERIEKSDINKQAAQTASLSSAASNLNAESAVRTLMDTPVDRLKAINENIKDGHEDLYANSIEQGAKAYDEKNINEKRALYADQLLLKTQGDVKLMASKIKENPEEFIRSIEESTELEPQQKQDLLEKVQTFVESPATGSKDIVPVTEVPVQEAAVPETPVEETAFEKPAEPVQPIPEIAETPIQEPGETVVPMPVIETSKKTIPPLNTPRLGNEQENQIAAKALQKGIKPEDYKTVDDFKDYFDDKEIFQIAKDSGLKVVVLTPEMVEANPLLKGANGKYLYNNTIMVDPAYLGKDYRGTNVIQHEAAHAFTVSVLQEKNEANLNPIEKQFRDEVKKSFQENKNTLFKPYGLKNELEFVAEFYGNPKFRDYLKNENISLWQKFVKLLSGVLKIDNTKLDKVFGDFKQSMLPSESIKELPVKKVETKEIAETPIIEAAESIQESGAAEKPPVEPPKEPKPVEPVPEDKTTTLRNKDVEAKRAEYGFDEPASRKGTTDAEFDAEAEKQIKEGHDTHALMDKILLDKKPISGVESVILAKYQGAKEAELLDVNDKIEKATDSSSVTFNQLVADRDRVLEDLQRAYNASEASGTVASDALRARKVRVAQDNSLAGFLVRERSQVNKGEKLSQEQIKEVSAEYADIKAKNEAYQKKIEELQAQVQTQEAEKALKKVQEQVKLETRRNKRGAKVEELDKEINDVFANLKKIAREKRGTLSANPIPIEYLPELAKLVKLYTQKGATTLAGVVDDIYHGLKDDIEGLTKEHVLEAIGNLPEAAKKDPLKAIKSRLKSSIRRVQEKTAAEDFTPTKRNKVVLDEEALKLRDELEKARYEYELRLHRDAYKNRTTKQKVRDAITEIINTPRALLASTDFSAPLRQGLLPTVAHPALASRAFSHMFKAAFSQNAFDRWFYDLKEAPDYSTIKDSKLYVSDPHKPELAAKEEQFMSNLAEKIPFFGKMIRGSERAYVGYLNKLRVDLFRQTSELYETQGKTMANNPELYKGLAKFINNATGRGDFTNENLAQALNLVLFSPRLIASRLNLLNPVWYAKLPKEVRYQAIGDMAKFIGVGVSLLALAKANGFQVEADPRSSDFGKLRSGDKRWDIWGGFSQYVRLFAQELTGQTKSTSTGDITELGGKKFGARTRLDVATGFMRNKLSPVPAFIANSLAGKDAMGQEFDPVQSIPKNLIPLTLQDTYQAVQKEGLQGIFSTGLPTTFGVGVQTYSDLKPPKEVVPKETIEVANGGKYKLTEEQLAERKRFNDEWLAKHEAKQRAIYTKAAANDAELKMEIATKSAKYRAMGQSKEYIDAHRQALIDNYVTRKLSAAANKYSKVQMLKKYRGQKTGQYNLEKSEE